MGKAAALALAFALASLVASAEVVLENAQARLEIGDDAVVRSLRIKATGEEMLGTRNFETHCRLEFGKWSNVRVVNAGDRLEVSVNGKAIKEYPIRLPGHSSSGTTVGGFPNWSNLCFFKGRIRNLRIDHRACR